MHLGWAAGCALVLLAGAMAADEGRRARQTPDVRSLLRDVAHFTDADWTAVEKGAPVAKILDTDSREVAVAGAVRIAAPRERLVARLRDIEHLKRSAVVLDAGRFGNSPSAADVAKIPLEDYSLDLRDCRTGDCRVRLTAADIDAFHRSVDWQRDDWRARAAVVWRDVLAGHARAYITLGRKGLPVYVNKADALSVASELSLLVGNFR